MPQETFEELQAKLNALKVAFEDVDQRLIESCLRSAEKETGAPRWLDSQEGQVARRIAVGLDNTQLDDGTTGPEPDHLLNAIVFLAGRKYEALLTRPHVPRR
jgi:hypothetical protein